MTRFDSVTEEERWGFVDKSGLPHLVEEHRYGLDPFSLWFIAGGSVAVLFEGLRHIPEERLQLGSFKGAVVVLVQSPSHESVVEAVSLLEVGMPQEALAAAASFAGVSAGLRSLDEVQTLDLNGSRFKVTVRFDFERMTWKCNVQP